MRYVEICSFKFGRFTLNRRQLQSICMVNGYISITGTNETRQNFYHFIKTTTTKSAKLTLKRGQQALASTLLRLAHT